ncbi:hypothetical protein P3S68_019566 [Capsicum galapagoense]
MYANLFSGFAWHFFDVVPNNDLDKPEVVGLKCKRYLGIDFIYRMLKNESSERFAQILGHTRGPRHLRCISVPLPPGWIKLNIYGVGTKGNQLGQFSGVFGDENGMCLSRYRGEIDVEDNVIAGLEALRLGLVRCKEGKPNARKLLVESDNVMLVQYVNGRPEPNPITMYRLKEIFDLLKHITCAFLYIYEEANEAARDWIFEAFGPVELVQLPIDLETGHCKGFGFVQFAQLEHAKAAQSLNGKLEIAGRTIKVFNALSRALLMAILDDVGAVSGVAGTLGVPAEAPGQPAMSMPTGGATAFPNMLPTQDFASMAPEPIGIPSECLLLKIMLDPATEMDPEFYLDIKDYVKQECSKYGRVKHIHVDKNSSGYVYLWFDSVKAASRAQQAMHKRWFAGRSISAIFLQPYEYDAKFKGTDGG